jgi:hypothetical protein
MINDSRTYRLKNPGPALRSKVLGSRQLFPDEFLAKVGLETVVQQSPLDVEPNEPGWDGLIESRVEQERTNERRKTNVYLLSELDTELKSTVKLPSGLIGTRTRTLVPEGTTIVVNGLTVEGDQRNLGNGFLDQVVVQAPSKFPHFVARTSIEDGIPPVFRMLIPLRELASTALGTSSIAPVLGPGELSRQEEQEDVFSFRRSISTRLPPSLPAAFIFKRLGGDRFGGAVMQVAALLDDVEPFIEFGLGVTESEVKPLGNGLFLRTTEKWFTNVAWPILHSELWDGEIKNWRIEETQVVVPTYTPVNGTFFVESLKAIDFTKSQRIKVTRQPTNLGEANATISDKWHPYQFPGWLDRAPGGFYVRRTHADLCRHTIKEWFEVSATKPVIPVSEIIMDNPIINSLNDTSVLAYAGECLHDELVTFGVFFWAATIPTGTEYARGTLIGTELLNFVTLFTPGTGYNVGDLITVAGDGGSVVVTVTAVGVSDSILTWTPTVGSVGWAEGSFGPYTGLGGSGSGAQWNASGFQSPLYDDSTRWIGNPKVIAANVEETEIPDLWKIQTTSIVMR